MATPPMVRRIYVAQAEVTLQGEHSEFCWFPLLADLVIFAGKQWTSVAEDYSGSLSTTPHQQGYAAMRPNSPQQNVN